jgi:hypothetical protein
MLKPLRLVLFTSKIVLRKYFEAPGDAVRSLVKSLFLPLPIPAPDFLKVEGILYILSQLDNRVVTRL